MGHVMDMVISIIWVGATVSLLIGGIGLILGWWGLP
jgi:hypothetical protein